MLRQSVGDRIVTFGNLLQYIGGKSSGITYLLRDQFTTDQAAPLTSPRTCEPGPGAMTKQADTGNRAAIAGSKLVITGGLAGYTDPVYTWTAQTRAIGHMIAIDWLRTAAGQSLWGYTTNAASPVLGGGAIYEFNLSADLRFFGADQNVLVDATNYGNGTTYQLAIILRSTGCFYLIKGGAYTNWALLWVSATNNSATLTPFVVNFTTTTATTWDNHRAAQLGAPWTTDTGLATSYTASASAGATTTSEANAIIEATWSAVTGETYELDIRRTDDDNRWIVRGSQGGSTIKLIERNAGVETERASASQTWTNGTSYRIVAIQDGNTIRTFVASVAKNTYASATFNNTATGIKTSHAVTNLTAWPRNLSGAALSGVSAVV